MNPRFQATTEASGGSADPQFTRIPKFFVADDRFNKIQEHSKERLNNPVTPLDNGENGDDDNIQDASSEESSKLPQANSDIHGTVSDNEMLFDTFIERLSTSQGKTSPVRKRQRTGDPTSTKVTHGADLPSILPLPKAIASAHRYRLPTTSATQDTFAPPIPSFLTPAPMTEDLEASIPVIFSPHRKSQKFLQAGLASSMRDHIIETMPLHTQSSSKTKNNFNVRVIRARRLSGMSLIEGIIQTSIEINLLLTGPAATPQVDDLIQIKGITWAIEIQGRIWTVVLDWKVER